MQAKLELQKTSNEAKTIIYPLYAAVDRSGGIRISEIEIENQTCTSNF